MPTMSAPLFDLFEPAPFSGSTPSTRACSASGARKALSDGGSKAAHLARIWSQPHTLQAVAAISGYPVNVVTSRMQTLKKRGLTAVDVHERLWADGSTTKRTVWVMLQAVKS